MEQDQETDGELPDVNPFAIPRAWIISAALETMTTPADSLFQIPQLEFPSIGFKYTQAESLDFSHSLVLPDFDRFNVGPLENLDELPDSSATSSSESEYYTELREEVHGQDIWSIACELGLLKDEPKLLTWEAFANANHVESAPLFISEAGAAAFDAALTLQAKQARGFLQAGRVLQSDPLLRSLMFLAFGRPSILFPLDFETNTFYQAIDDGRMSGYSLGSFQHLIEEFLDLGNAVLGLRRFKEEAYAPTESLPSKIALASAVDMALSAIEERFVRDAGLAKTSLELQALAQRPTSVIDTLKQVVDYSSTADSNEQIVSRVFEKLQYLEDCGKDVDIAFHIFKRVSGPWLDTTMEQIGLRHSFDNKSITMDSNNGRHSECESFQARNTPSFLSVACEEMIQDAQRCLHFIRDFHPNHPLMRPHCSGVRAPPLEWAINSEALDRISQKAEKYHQSLISAVADFELKGWIADNGSSRQSLDAGISNAQTVDWPDLIGDSALETSIANLSADPNPLASDLPDELHSLIMAQHDASIEPATTCASLSIAFICSLSLNSLITTQHALLATTTLRSILSDHDLHQHLDLVHSFHLCGSGVFVSNLTRVLFSDDVEAAERTKGVVRTGMGAMGLRLGSGQRREWPPASSELTLALMNLLNQSWLSHAGMSERATRSSRKSETPFPDPSDSRIMENRAEQLPGGLSFAIRTDVSQDEIEKILDPQSIYALDFLRLSYTPPPALSSLFTPQTMEKYDRIFKLLLRMLRVKHVVGELHKETMLSSRRKRPRRVGARDKAEEERAGETLIHAFRYRATHFITTLCSHFLNSGLSKHWREMLQYTAALEAHVFSSSVITPTSAVALSPTSDHNSSAQKHRARHQSQGQEFSLARLADVHEATLAKMTASLLLRARQRKLAAALEAMLGDILHFAALLRDQRREGGNSGGGAGWLADLKSLYRAFDTRLLRFKEALGDANDKADNSAAAVTVRTARDDDGDVGSLKGLLDRLS